MINLILTEFRLISQISPDTQAGQINQGVQASGYLEPHEGVYSEHARAHVRRRQLS